VIGSGEASGAEMRDVGLETRVVSAAMLKNSYLQSSRKCEETEKWNYGCEVNKCRARVGLNSDSSEVNDSTFR
jgi:hypothetical protein